MSCLASRHILKKTVKLGTTQACLCPVLLGINEAFQEACKISIVCTITTTNFHCSSKNPKNGFVHSISQESSKAGNWMSADDIFEWKMWKVVNCVQCNNISALRCHPFSIFYLTYSLTSEKNISRYRWSLQRNQHLVCPTCYGSWHGKTLCELKRLKKLFFCQYT